MSNVALELISLARRIGKWLLRRVITRGAVRLGHYLIEHCEVFRNRLARAKTERRKRWLKGRISRWTKSGNWLLAWAAPVAKCVTDEADAMLAKAAKLPEVARCEKQVAA